MTNIEGSVGAVLEVLHTKTDFTPEEEMKAYSESLKALSDLLDIANAE